MAVIYVPGAITGTQYPIQISGDTPTPTEQARIDQYIAQQEAAAQSQYESIYGSLGQRQAEAPPEDTTAFGRGLESGIASLRRAYGSTLEGVGGTIGLTGLAQYGAGIAEEQDAEMQRLAQAAEAEKAREDQGMIGRGATYVGELAGQSAPQTGVSLLGSIAGGAAAGLAAGSFTGPGALAGAALGGAFAALPYFYGDFREQQKEADIAAGRPVEVDEGAAALAAIPAATLDAILGAVGAKVGANVLTKTAQKGGVFTRATRGAVGGVAVETPTELGQEVLGRLQAGEDLLSDEAIEAYKEAAIGAAVLGGGIGAVGGAAVSGKGAEEGRKKKELKEDIDELSAQGAEYIKNAQEAQPVEEAEGQLAIEGPMVAGLLPAPSTARTTPQEETALRGKAGMEAVTGYKPVRLVDLPLQERLAIQRARAASGQPPSPSVTIQEIQSVIGTEAAARESVKQKPVTGGTERFAPVQSKLFTQQQLDRVIQQIKADKAVSIPKIRAAVASVTKKRVPNSVVNSMRDELVRRGVIRADKKSRSGYSLEPIAAQDTAESALRREIDSLNKQIDTSLKDRVRLLEDVRRVEQTGRDLSGRRASTTEANQRLDTLDASIEAAKARVAAAEAQIQRAKAEGSVPSVERIASEVGRRVAPISEATPDVLAARRDAAGQAVEGYRTELAAVKKRIDALNRKAGKAPLTNAERETKSKLTTRSGYLSYMLKQAEDRIKSPSEAVQVAPEREAAAQARLAAEAVAEPAPLTQQYTDQQDKVFDALKRRLNNLGLKDVRLKRQQLMVSKDEAGNITALQEGTYDPNKKILTLAMGIYEKGLTSQQLFDRLASVMNHEVIHALRLMGLITDPEWKVLTNFAKQKRYVAIKQGKPVARSYTYTERAAAMGYANDVVEEEAVAEIFRDYLDGKIDVKGKPKSLMEKIKNFFKALIGAHVDNGFDSVEKIFAGIRSGEIGARERPAPLAEAARESRVPISRDLKSLSVISRTDDGGDFKDTAPRTAKGKIAWVNKEDAMRRLQEDRGGFVFDLNDPASQDPISTIMAAEAERALSGDKSAIGWYDKHVRLAKQLLAILHPEIADDPAASHAIDFATAITSNGLSVKDNYIFANKQYNNWKRTGFFLEEGSGKQGGSMVAAFKSYNMMKRSEADGGLGMSDAEIEAFLNERTTVGQLKKDPVVQALGIKVDSKEKADTPVNVSYILGPKIGQGFYQNLRGNFNELTMDRWWMRFFNRVTGNPFRTYADGTIQKGIDRLRSALTRNYMSPLEAEIVDRAREQSDTFSLTDESVGTMAVEIDRLYQRAYAKAPKDAKPEKTELFKAADALRPKIEGELEEAPRNASDRAFMRETTRQAIQKLEAATGEKITMADFQALMWYWEKRLWRSLGIRSGRGEDNDYVDGAIELLRKEGTPDEQIAEALPDSERRRLDAGRDDGSADEGSFGVSGEPLEGGATVAEQERSDYARDVKAKRDAAIDPRQSIIPMRNSVASVAQRQTARQQTNVVYSKAADFLAKGLRIPGVGVDEKRSKEIADGIIKKFQDGMIPVGRMIDELRANGLNITDAMDTYMQEELYHGVVGERVEQAQTNLYRPLIDILKELTVTDSDKEALQRISGFARVAFDNTRSDPLSLADVYLYARHAKERNEYIAQMDPSNPAGSGMTDAEADAILNWFAGSRYAGAMRRIEGAAQAIVKSTNDVRLDGGLIPSDVFERVDEETGEVVAVPQYDFYVPLRGKRDPDSGALIDNDITGPYRSPMYGARRREDRRAMGRYDYADNIISNLFVQNQNAIIRSERNKVGQSFLKLLRSDPAVTRGYGRILTPGDMQAVKTRIIRQGRRADGTIGDKVVEVMDPQFRQAPDIFIVKENGKEVIVKLEDENIASALKGSMSPTQGNALVRAMSTMNRYLASINTSYNPAFFITNMARDLQTAGVNVGQYEIEGLTSQIMKAMPGALAGIKQSIRNNDNSSEWAKIYRDFVKNGGQNAVNQVNTVADQMANINSIIGEIAQNGALGKYQMVKNSFAGKGARSLLSFIENFNTVIENGIRVATYKSLLDRGFTPQRAAQAARNVTVNFAKGGDYKGFMNAMYLFYNASLQGSFAMLNAALRSKKVQRLWVGMIGVGVMQDVMNALLSEEDDDGRKQYDKIAPYVLEHNLILPDPFGFTDRSYISIPLPYGLNMAHNLGRALSRAARGEYSPSEAGSTIFGTALNVINPIGGTESFANFAAPTIADPFIDVMENENFANAPVYKEGFPGDRTPSSQLYWSTTSVPAVWLAKTMNSLTGGTTEVEGLVDVSPDIIEFWFEYLTGGAGRFVLQTAQAPFAVFDEGFSEDVVRNLPLASKIIGTVTTREDMGEYIEKRNRVLTALDELKAAAESGDARRIVAARDRFPDELRIAGAIRAIDTARNRLSRQAREIRESNLPEDRKRAALEAIDTRVQQLVSRGNQLMRGL